MHEDLIGRLKFALEKQKAGAFSYLFSESIAALSAQPDAASGGDARAQFEKWLDRSWSREGQTDADGDFVYHEDWVQGAWIGWQAALAARPPVTMEDAIEAGDGTLHGAVDHWQERALRAEAELAARQPVGVEPFGWWVEDANGVGYFRRTIHPTYLAEYQYTPGYSATQLYTAPPAPAAVPVGLQDIIGSMLNYAGVADTCEVTQGHAPVAIRNWAEMLQQLAWPAAVPVDVVDALRNMMGAFDNAVRRMKMPDPFCDEAIQSGRDALVAYDATHPQPAAAELGNRTDSKLEQELQKLESKLGLKREQSAPWTAEQKAECKAAMRRIRERESGKPAAAGGDA